MSLTTKVKVEFRSLLDRWSKEAKTPGTRVDPGSSLSQCVLWLQPTNTNKQLAYEVAKVNYRAIEIESE